MTPANICSPLSVPPTASLSNSNTSASLSAHSLVSSKGGLTLTPKSATKLTLSPKLNISPAATQKLTLGNLNKIDLKSSSLGATSLSNLAKSHLGVTPISQSNQPKLGFGAATTAAAGTDKPSLGLSNTSGVKLKLSLSNLSVSPSNKTPLSLGKGNKTVPQTTLGLSAAIKTKVPTAAPAQISAEEPMDVTPQISDNKPELQSSKGQLVFYDDDEVINDKLLPNSVSKLGQLLCRRQPALRVTEPNQDGWSYAEQLARSHHKHTETKLPYHCIQPFNFLSQSPDDVVLSKQRGAFTRTGESKKYHW